MLYFFFSSRRRHTRLQGDGSSDVCSSDLAGANEDRLAGASPEWTVVELDDELAGDNHKALVAILTVPASVKPTAAGVEDDVSANAGELSVRPCRGAVSGWGSSTSALRRSSLRPKAQPPATTAASPRETTATISTRSSSTTPSAGAPGSSTPRSERPSRRAGTDEAAPTACSSWTPSRCRLRTASIIVSTVPASVPSSRTGGAPSTTDTCVSPSLNSPSPAPAAAIASVINATRPCAEDHTSRTVSSARWLPSTIIVRTTSARVSAAPMTPGAPDCYWRIALKTCVTPVAPRLNARTASSALASV